jgi:hypothetical protein
MERLALLVLSIMFIKNITIGNEFNFIKYFRNRKDYWKKYNEWLSNKP